MAEQQDRRELILANAAELFARKGVSATTVREIADTVGVLSGSLYHHFSSKDAIVDEIITGYLNELREAYRRAVEEYTEPRACIHALVTVSLETSEAHPHATEIYQNDFNYLRELPQFSYLKSAAAEVQKTWLDVIERGVEQGVLRSDIPPRVFYRFIRDAVWLAVRWHKPGGGYSTAKLADDCTSIFLDGFAAKNGRRSARTPNKVAGSAR